MDRILIAGLGNPGREFKDTRHNVGFLALDSLRKKWGFPDFKSVKKYKAQISRGSFNGRNIILAKPLTFMNESGRSVKKIVGSGRQIPDINLLVIHDDADIPLGKIKISRGSGSGGHKGVRSIIEALGSKEFSRVRLGIRPEGNKEKAQVFVLEEFSGQEKQKLQEMLELAGRLIEEKPC